MNDYKNHKIKDALVQREIYACQTCLISDILSNYELGESLGITWEEIENLYHKPEEQDILYKLENLTGLTDPEEVREAIDRIEEFWEDNSHLLGRKDPVNKWSSPLSDGALKWAHNKSEAEELLERLEDLEEQPQEIYEWWLVSNWFAEKLSQWGEPTLTDGQSIWWGRTTTGQAISLDGVIVVQFISLISGIWSVRGPVDTGLGSPVIFCL